MKLWLVSAIVGCVALASAQEHPPMVPPAGPGVFTVKPSGPGTFKLVATGHAFTSRGDIEKYLAYRAARHTIEQGGEWFTFTEIRLMAMPWLMVNVERVVPASAIGLGGSDE